jgi:hypothetical protein
MRPVGAEFFHADTQKDGRTDTAKPIIAFRNFVNSPKIVYILPTQYIRVLYGSQKKTGIFFLYSMK